MKRRQQVHCCALAATLFAVAVQQATAVGPLVRSVLPAGGQRGTTVEVTATGTLANWPVQAWVDRPGVTITPEAEKGKLSVAISSDAACGVCWLRLFDGAGASVPRPFLVGTIREVLELEPNSEPSKAQPVDLPVIVNGKLGGNGDVDLFVVALRKGQMLVASLEAHETLGSPVDAVMQIVSPRGDVLAYNHDERGLDPQIVLAAPADGSYLVRVFGFPATPNQTIAFAGGDQYVYRLTLTTGPFLDYAWPLAMTRDRETQVALSGWNLPTALRSLLVRPTGDKIDIFDAQLPNTLSIAVESHETMVENEPNDSTPQTIELPVTITARMDQPRDIDRFTFTAKGGQSLTFQLESRALGYPLDGVLQLLDAAGKVLARADDVGNARDPLLTFAAPSDGQYTLVVRDLNGQGSSRHVYRLRATQTRADFEVTTDADSYVITSGKTTDVTLSVARRNGFEEEIDFVVTGLPEFITASRATSASQGETAKAVKLTLTGQGSFSGPIRIAAKAKGASQIERTAAAIAGGNARVSDLWLSVTPAEAK